MIKALLEYQKKESEKLALLGAVEGGRVKREFDEANRMIENAKKMLLNLENDAKTLTTNYQNIAQSLDENFEKISAHNKKLEKSGDSIYKDEEEANTEMGLISSLLSKISSYESQLNDISAKINAKINAFEETKIQVVKAQKVAAGSGAQYENEKKAIQPKLEKIDAELKTLGDAVNPNLLAKYKAIRKNKPKGDIVVQLNGNRCGGCHFELPLSLIHTVSNQGYIICEECGKIIYRT